MNQIQWLDLRPARDLGERAVVIRALRFDKTLQIEGVGVGHWR